MYYLQLIQVCPQFNIKVNLKRSLLRFYLLYSLQQEKNLDLLHKENLVFEKCLSIKLTMFPKGSKLVLTFD